ncbi:ABC transporter substrate-binding protein [Jiella sp. M17.18]|uniref:ABC transporter substrate-binding protein n=1 Tax=Jiella sp. M17.18 TaxID=3234247 RepID=UPI0034DEAEB5
MLRRTLLKGLAASAALPLVLDAPFAFANGPDTLDVAIVSDPVTLDPALMASFFELSVQYNIFEPLLNVTPDLKIEPGLAELSAPDDKTYVLQLKKDLTFHDGTPVDAKAVKANFDRMLDPATGSPRRSELGPIGKVEATGPLEVTITLTAPYAPFAQVLANRAGMMVSPTAVERLGADFATKAVGAGPYKVVSWDKNSKLVLEAFDGYWRGAPAIKTVVFRPITDETVRVTNLRSGTVQLADGVAPQLVSQIKRSGDLTLKEKPGLGFNAFSFNTTRAPFDKAAVRQAFSTAVDPAIVQRAVYVGTGSVSYGAVPPSIGWAFDKSLHPARGDADAAKKLLADAGVSEPVPVAITVTNSPLQVRTAEILQAQAGKAGFKVTIKQIDPTSLITVLRKKDFDLCMSPWSGRSDPDGNMYNYFTKGGPNNFAGYKSDKVDKLLKDARTTLDQGERAKMYKETQQIIADDAPMLFLTFPATLQASRKSLDWKQWPDGALRLQFAKFA